MSFNKRSLSNLFSKKAQNAALNPAVRLPFTVAFIAPPQKHSTAPLADILVLPVADGNRLGSRGVVLDRGCLGGYIAAQLATDPKFNGKTGQILSITPPQNAGYKRIILLGAGKPEALSGLDTELLGGPLGRALRESGYASAEIMADLPGINAAYEANLAAHLANGLLLSSYSFDKYRTNKPAPALTEIKMNTLVAEAAETVFAPLRAATEGSYWARDLTAEPGNQLYPDSYAQQIRDELSPLGVKITILNEKDMERLGMGAALSVGQGSRKPPRMVVMEYDGTNGSDKGAPLALVGKGITFDTGGISLKPGAGMGAMKGDMGGSAAVVGAMRALATRKAGAKVVSIVALAENMPDGNATRPGDIVKSMNGLTIDVGNTDAEGRMVLADALTYIQRTYKPHTVIDVATLTGAKVAALGDTYAGMFSNDDDLAAQISAAGLETGEKGWRMPLHEDYARAMNGTDADLNNTGGRAGACTAAGFLHNFIEKDEQGKDRCKWAHLDIAGMFRGFGARLLDRLVADHYEQKPAPRQPGPAPKA